MLLEGYLAKLNTYPLDEIKIVVTRTAHSILAPSKELLWLYKDGKITWDEYKIAYIHQISNDPNAVFEMKRIKRLAMINDVRLICYEKNYPCHRFLLMEMINNLELDET